MFNDVFTANWFVLCETPEKSKSNKIVIKINLILLLHIVERGMWVPFWIWICNALIMSGDESKIFPSINSRLCASVESFSTFFTILFYSPCVIVSHALIEYVSKQMAIPTGFFCLLWCLVQNGIKISCNKFADVEYIYNLLAGVFENWYWKLCKFFSSSLAHLSLTLICLLCVRTFFIIVTASADQSFFYSLGLYEYSKYLSIISYIFHNLPLLIFIII